MISLGSDQELGYLDSRWKSIAHELPLDLIVKHQDPINDYMFILLHKVLEDKEYTQQVINYQGSTILDNSCYELGEALDDEKLYAAFRTIQPDLLILPDTLGNKQKTIDRTLGFLKKYKLEDSSCAVIQGSSPEEMIECYEVFKKTDVAVIGIPFTYSWIPKEPTVQADERIQLLDRMVKEGIIDTGRPHHLFGTWQAREFTYYWDYDWIASIDTSNPVMAAIEGTRYGEFGIDHKPKATFDSVFHMKESDINLELLYHNVLQFRRIVNETSKSPREAANN